MITVFGYALADWLTVASLVSALALAIEAAHMRRQRDAARQRAGVYAADMVTVKPQPDELAAVRQQLADARNERADMWRELLVTTDALDTARSVHAQHMRRCLGQRNTPTTSG